MNTKTIRKPEDHDWTGCLCTFRGRLDESGRPAVGADGRVAPGETKIKGIVTGQTYLGRDNKWNIPDFEIEVKGTKEGSRAVLKIGLMANSFQVVD
jgi:hypothetical protein